MLKLPEKINHPYSMSELAGLNKIYPHCTIDQSNINGLNRVNSAQPAVLPQQVQNNFRTSPRQDYSQYNQPAPRQNYSQYNQPAPRQNFSSSPPPAPKPMPPLTKPVKKGMKVPVFTGGSVSPIKAGVGWKIKDSRCDVDASVFLLGENEKVISEDWFVFYSQPQSPDRSVIYNMNDPVYEKSFSIDLNKLNSSVQKIVFVVTIDEALSKSLNFAMLSDVFLRITDASGSELLSFCLTDYYSNVTSMMVGEIYSNKGQWKFNAIGNGIARDLAGLCEFYGIEVI